MKGLAGLTWFLLLLAGPAGAESVTLATYHSPPYQVTPGKGSPVSGHTVETVECVLTAMGWQGDYRTLPPGRGIQALRHNLVDGYFAVDPTLDLDAFAKPTAPIALEKWYFLALEQPDTLLRKRIGAVRSANEAAWLTSQNYGDLLTVSSPSQLIPLLRRGRVDAILKDWQFLEYRQSRDTTRADQQSRDLYRHFVRYAPLHLYLSHDFAATHPSFIQRFNQHISSCTTPSFDLDAHERVILKERARKAMRALKRQINLSAAATRLPPYTRFRELIREDRQWREKAPGAMPELSEQLLGRSASVALAEWQATQNKEITETFVVNWEGGITALSRLTSDLWQGDETKFQALLAAEPGEIHLESLIYDASTRRFQVMASTPLHSDSGRFVGGLIMGLDVEQVLRHAIGPEPGKTPSPRPY